MGFLDKAKAAAADLQQKADQAMANSGMMGGNPMGGPGGGSGGPTDRLLRDLGVLTYLNAVGRPGSGEDYQRIMDQLRQAEAAGQLNLQLTPSYGAPGGPPPPPGAAAAAAAGGGSAAPPPPGGPTAPPPAPAAAPTPSDAPAAGPAPADPQTRDAGDSDTALGGGGGQAPPPPPPSWG